MTIAEGSAALSAASQPQDAAQAQNLFEHAAAHARGLPEGASPAQLGGEVMQGLQGYIERSGSLAERSQRLTQGTPEGALPEFVSFSQGSFPGVPAAQPAPPQVNESQMDRAVESLGLMFDHAIETQLVVRGATQIAGAANTLLRGQ